MQALSIDRLRKVYRNGKVALEGIDLTVEEGDFFALLGPNGAGKSTTIGIVSGLVNKTAGRVRVFGHDLDREPEAAKACIGLVPQEINFSQFETVQEIVVNQGGFYGLPRRLARQRAERYLREVGLWDRRRDRSRNLSGGLKRRLMIARALVHEPRLLILDEPTAGVDIELRRSMWSFLRGINDQGTTIILTTHYLEEAENLCRHIAIIDGGHLVEHQTMKGLLARLHAEVFLLDLRWPVREAPLLDGYRISRVDESTLEVEISRDRDLNDLFRKLSEQGLEVMSMRNKANRLEELFLGLVNKDKAAER